MTALNDEWAYNRAMEGIAVGATYDEVIRDLVEDADLPVTAAREIMRDALDGAMSTGVERADIDESWFKHGRARP